MNIDLSKAMYEGEPNANSNLFSNINNLGAESNNAFIIDEALGSSASAQAPVIAIKKENARSRIAFLYVSSFLAIIVIVFAYSLVSVLKINDIKDLLITVSGIMSGPLGFIIGYYFKSEDENNK